MNAANLNSQASSSSLEQKSEDFDANEITKHLNEYYFKVKAEVDPVFLKMVILSLETDGWEI